MPENEARAADAEQMFKDLFGDNEAAREAVIASLKPDEQEHARKLALACTGLRKKELNPEDTAFLSERAEAGEAKRTRLGFKKNFKKTFKLFAEVYGVRCPTDFGTSGFQALCDTFALRDRVMHPK